MPAPREIPGFYFDAGKNRYFPINKGPIPGRGPKRPPPPAVADAEAAASSSSSSSSSHPSSSRVRSKPHEGRHLNVTHGRKRRRSADLLQLRELHGRLITFNESRWNFEQEYEKLQVSHPLVWKYESTDLISDSALQQFQVPIQTPEGQQGTNVLSIGNKGGLFSLYEVGKVGRYLGCGFNPMPQPVWPISIKEETVCDSFPWTIWSTAGASTMFSSSVSSILKIGKHSCSTADHCPFFLNALVTTLGSGALGGSVYFLNFNEPLDFNSSVFSHQRASRIASFDFTIWTAACNSIGTQAALGTNRGAAILNLETGRLSWLYNTKSDIFSQQFDQSGNVVLCGLRNGSIVAVDVRQKQSGTLRLSHVSSRGIMTPASNMADVPLRKHAKKSSIQRCQMRRDKCCQRTFMSSAVCSLAPLLTDEQYFLGSSMDGSIKLLDRRLLHRGAVQSYEGHVNSHTHLQLGVNPSETLVMSGGEDCYLRIWSIKSGELIFAENVSQSILKTVCWPQNGYYSNGLHLCLINLFLDVFTLFTFSYCFTKSHRAGLRRPACRQYLYGNLCDFNQTSGAWLGSQDGLFYMQRA